MIIIIIIILEVKMVGKFQFLDYLLNTASEFLCETTVENSITLVYIYHLFHNIF